MLAVKGEPSPALAALLSAVGKDTQQPLASFSRATPFVSQTMVPDRPVQAGANGAEGMVAIPAADYDFAVNGIEVENGNNPGVDVQFPWEDAPRRNHRHRIHVARFFIDRTR